MANTHEVILYYVASSGDSRNRQLKAGSFAQCQQFCADYNRAHGKGAACVEALREEDPLPVYSYPPFT